MAQLRPKQKQMCDKDDIIRSVQNCLDGMLKKTEGASPDQLELPSWWTRQTMIALCGWGLRKGFHVCASKMKDEADMIELAQKCGGIIQGEWLNDFTCLDHDDDGWLKRIPLVAESEWNDKKDEIEKDFKRLLVARADVRVMVFNGNRYRTDESRSSQGKTSIESGGLEKFTKYINECEHTQAGDTYLLASRLHEGEGGISVNHRFDFYRFDAPSTTWSRPVR
ncbi:MAG: hypothetical protein OXI92_09115 [Acidobacteriota bacterium]|nr:hypothetical protein [Acidobacteriota bacterium]